MAASDPILDPLNPPQRQAVLHRNGPIFILAGAGSGKTRALTHRIAMLMREGVAPWNILAVTFTNKAAREMQERIARLLHIVQMKGTPSPFEPAKEKQPQLPVMGTFHSVCMRILRRDIEDIGRDRNFVIYDTDDQEKLIKQVMKDLQIDEAELKPRPALSAIGRFKSEALSVAEAQSQATSERMKRIAQVFEHYEKALRRSNALDFDDLILECVRLFHECPEVLRRYQRTWQYLHVDEYKDTNHAQYLWITLLASAHKNLCVIGDPDQSIYGFRGADIRNILEFQEEYPDATQIKLEENYRSTQPILTAADAVIAPNPNRPEKHMWTNRKEGQSVIAHECSDEGAEAREAVKAVEEHLAGGTPLREQVLLYRTHAQSRLLEEACMRAGIAYRILGGVKFYGRAEVKDVLAYLHLLLNPQDTVSLLRVINIPARKIGDRTLERLHAYAAEHKLTLWESLCDAGNIPDLAGATAERIGRFTRTIASFQAQIDATPPAALCHALLVELGIEEWLCDGTEEGQNRWGNVLELLSVMKKYDPLPPREGLQSFLEEAALVSEVDKLDDGKKDALTLMTLHLCKGLEFEHVVIIGCEEGIFPHSSALFSKEQLEEERRLLYVGMTRAKTALRLMFTQSRMLWGERRSNAPSRFLDDLPDAVTEQRSDNLLSAFGWAAEHGRETFQGTPGQKGARKSVQAYKQEEVRIEFNQDIACEEDRFADLKEGSRIRHPTFGEGTILKRRGDVVEVQFDSGKHISLALSIAPLHIL